MAPSFLINQELLEEVREFAVRIERKNIGDVLVGAHDHQRSFRTVDATQDENVRPVLGVGREDLLVVDQPELALARQEKRRQVLDPEVAVALLEDRPYIYRAVNIRSVRRVAL